MLAVTGHWIASNPSAPSEWQLHQQCLAFRLIRGRHDGVNIGNLLFKVLKELGLERKLGWTVSDNAATNDAAVKHLSVLLQLEGVDCNPTRMRGR